ncbi:hypothetical protein SAMN03159423_3598 [Bradyrhizobium sp. NFR13]|jgi:hypothetical protein|uniref:hypothetical protein n=1 Tax=Bradyrhizobium sp. NFR13 TaxID=1566285 RepID=UPI0008E7F8E3|nr:hypothetical protein [Bradyrhizobium sp. NFR13]SFL77383.1 hypothetical protein SAMN03159423_3598 [Bradyrhizobium sp. NFR13]
MGVIIVLIAINGLAGFALGLLGRSRIAVFVLFGSMLFSAVVLLVNVEGQIVWKTVVCMFTGQAAFLLASTLVFFWSTKGHSTEIPSAQDVAVKAAKRWGKKPVSKVH